MPASIKLAEEYGDDVQVLFVESQSSSDADILRMAYDKKWMGTSAMWTSERVVNTSSSGLPSFALISSAGELVLEGHPLVMHKDIEEAIAADLDAAKKGPEDAPKDVRKAYAEFGKGKLGKAIEAAQKLVEEGGDEAEAAGSAIEDFEQRIESQLGRAEWMIENGYLGRAEQTLGDLGKALKGTAFIERIEALEAKLEDPERKAERDADAAFGKLHVALNKDGLEDNAKVLEKFVEKHSGTKTAERAQVLLSYARG